MERGATVRVKVTSGGRAVQGARVNVNGEGGQPFARFGPMSMTDENGTLVIESLALGDYALVVSKKGLVPERKSVQITEPAPNTD